ncbi:unnamed protein product [Symbiodinium natans]|uniref:Glycoside hydrolase family 5 domain-containing protein n=1 Tax=Symbiodinium natans TaxID=878477 RepID=A0A812SEM4_9DINO|nr:unnamed protein product [Symbiodinium natans]
MYKADVQREIPLIKRALSFTAFRVFLHSMIYFASPETFLKTLEEFLDICHANGIGVGFVFFDDCWHHSGLDLQKPCLPTKGLHNDCWMASPQDVERYLGVEHFKPYVQDLVRKFGQDPRVLWWEIINEPGIRKHPYPQGNFSEALRAAAFHWCKDLSPRQPVISCWNEADDTTRGTNTSISNSELNDAHQYNVPWNGTSNAVFQNLTGKMKGGLVTEAGARWYQGYPTDDGSPLTVVDWLTKLRGNPGAKFVPGVMLDWEVMVSNSNTRWHWFTPANAAEPAIPWHQHLFPDGSPVSYTEAAAIRRYITGKDDFIYFDDFLKDSNPNSDERFYVLSENAFRVPLPGTLHEALVEMAVWPTPLSTVVAKLGTLEVRLDVPRAQLSLVGHRNFSTAALECGVLSSSITATPKRAAWNMLRVLVKAGRVAVWLNPMYPEAFPDRAPMPSEPSRTIRALPPRFDVAVGQPLLGEIQVTADQGALLDYISVLPAVTYGTDWQPSAEVFT